MRECKIMKINQITKIITIFFLIFSTLQVINDAQAQTTAVENIAVVFVVDDSGSMASYDPQDLRYTAVKLMISSLDIGDKVGFVRFATNSEIVTENLIELSSEQVKKDLLTLIQPVEPYGYTDFKAGLEDAYSLLNSESLASYQTVVVFLTDGEPQIPNAYEGYEAEVMEAANALAVPIYAIGLTPEGQTAILTSIAEETGGELIPANTANDLIDSFLQILGQLKDRTVIKSQVGSDKRSFNFDLDPALVPYISKISFVASHADNLSVRVISPSGEEVMASDPSISFFMNTDPSFTVLTIDAPASGNWQLIASGSGDIQVRAIMRSRLRTAIISPQGLVEAGKPAVIVTNIIEEMQDGSLVKVVGDAQFSAEVILPDGSRQSLDRFYDDGTHGDQRANDGNFSREFVDTRLIGTYTINLSGKKGQIPVSTYRIFTTVDIPLLKVLEPRSAYYEIRTSPVPLEIAFNTTDQALSNFEGSLKLVLTDPAGKAQIVDLIQKEQVFSAVFMPEVDGKHTYQIDASSASIRGITLDQVISGEFEVKIIPSIKLEGSYFGFDNPLPTQRFDIGNINEGIPFTIKLSSNSVQDESVKVSAVQLPGFEILEKDALTVKPGVVNTITLHLKGSGALMPGTWNGFLQISPVSNVDIPNTQIPLSFELYQKTITFSIDQIIVECDRILCFKVKPIQIFINAISTSDKEEVINFSLEGLPGAAIVKPNQYIQPKANTYLLELTFEENLKPGNYTGAINFTVDNQNLSLINEQGGTDLRFSFKIPGIWERCGKLILLVGGLILLLGTIISLILKAKKKKKPIVRGSLIYWDVNNPYRQTTIDLTEFNKKELKLGCASLTAEGDDGGVDIQISDPSIQSHHLTLQAQRIDGELLLSIVPMDKVEEGFRSHTDTIQIEENCVYRIGSTEFKIIFDPII